MKDHEKAKLVNELTNAIKKLCPEAPAQLRQTISSIVNKRTHVFRWERAFDGTLVCTCGAWK